jgi:hypothetical protein
MLYDVKSKASTNNTSTRLYIYDSAEGMSIAQTDGYPSNIAFETQTKVFVFSTMRNINNLWVKVIPGDWCSSFRIRKLSFQ